MAVEATGGLEYLGPPSSPQTALATLAEPVRAWFDQKFGEPTPAQRLAWPALAEGKNPLLCAPTGSGKTLAAFLPIISQLLKQPFSSGIPCFSVPPLKALGNAARKTLRPHLHGIRQFWPGGTGNTRVELRPGNPPPPARRNLWLQPP